MILKAWHCQAFFMLMSFKIFLIGRERVIIKQVFDNSLLVEYVKSGKEQTVNPKLVRSVIVDPNKPKKFTKKKINQTPPMNSSTVTQHYDPEMKFKGVDKTVTTKW